MNGRIKILTWLCFFICLCVVGRLFELQVLNHNFLGAVVYSRPLSKKIIPAERGKIFLRDKEGLYPIALNIKVYNLIVSPNQVLSSKIKLSEWIEKIAPYLAISQTGEDSGEVLLIRENQETEKLKDLLIKLSNKDDYYEVLKRGISSDEVEKIKKLDLPGLSFEEISQRYYPENNLYSHITGFATPNRDCQTESCPEIQGQYGLERFFNQELSGQSGERFNEGLTDNFAKEVIKLAQPGTDLILTIDRSLQFFVCQTLESAIDEYGAESGTIIIMEPKTGGLLALCNYPNFDPNQYSQIKNYEVFKNSAVSDSFEPGSIFKVITMAAALDAGKVAPETTYLDSGILEIEGEKIKNASDRVFGYQTMTNVLEKSINTGAVFAAQELGKSSFRDYLKKFGFGSLTQIELANEASGDIANLEKKQKIYLATASFGQGITVTPIQMVNAVAAIANKGRLMKPYLVESFIDNNEEKKIGPKFVRQVISPATASTLTAMMISACENGWAKSARVKGYYVAGKTGTAQVPRKDGKGYSEEVIHSFVGFAPASNPRFVALVKLDNPRKKNFADSTAAPTFSKIAEFILNYYNIPPDKEISQ